MPTEAAKAKTKELNDRLNIKFERPGAGFLPSVQMMVDRMAAVIGVPAPQLRLPADGFLKEPLSVEQKNGVNGELGPIYARESVDFQAKLMDVPIAESREKMVSLKDRLARADVIVSYSDKPFHPASENGWAGKPREFWVREGVAGRLELAARALNEIGLMLHFEDAFRPVGVQEGLLKRRIAEFVLKEHPDWDPDRDFDKIMTEAQSKTAIMPRIAGHKGGAAVDVTLKQIDGSPLPLGNEYPQGDALVNMDCPYVTSAEWQTRQLFKTVMEMVGMTVYPGEDWHASLGDNLAGANPDGSAKNNYVAKYGPIKEFDRETGDVIPYPGSEYNEPFFTREQLKQMALQARENTL
ncbi:MAG: M15 family metallopeptidase [Patescibacteria group bacterium]